MNLKKLYSKIKAENPFAMFFAGDFNGKSQLWWPDGEETPEGREIEDMLTSLGLSQVISEPTNFEPGKKPSCIDIILFLLFMHFCPGTMTTHAESINSDLQRGLEKRLPHTQH